MWHFWYRDGKWRLSWMRSPRKQLEKGGRSWRVTNYPQPAHLFPLACVVFLKYLNKLLKRVYDILAAYIFSLLIAISWFPFKKLPILQSWTLCFRLSSTLDSQWSVWPRAGQAHLFPAPPSSSGQCDPGWPSQRQFWQGWRGSREEWDLQESPLFSA